MHTRTHSCTHTRTHTDAHTHTHTRPHITSSTVTCHKTAHTDTQTHTNAQARNYKTHAHCVKKLWWPHQITKTDSISPYAMPGQQVHFAWTTLRYLEKDAIHQNTRTFFRHVAIERCPLARTLRRASAKTAQVATRTHTRTHECAQRPHGGPKLFQRRRVRGSSAAWAHPATTRPRARPHAEHKPGNRGRPGCGTGAARMRLERSTGFPGHGSATIRPLPGHKPGSARPHRTHKRTRALTHTHTHNQQLDTLICHRALPHSTCQRIKYYDYFPELFFLGNGFAAENFSSLNIYFAKLGVFFS